jgi:methionyl-tRNA synthetase
VGHFYVTTPIYYVNAAPHLGHAYTVIACDVLARHHRQRGEDVFFLTGTDEHGEPVADAAKALGIEPKELADRNAERFKALMPRLEASNDFFIRTSDDEHKRRVQEVLQKVHDNGFTHLGMYEGWYCPRCADFKVENEIGPDNTCPIHEIPLVREQEENWFFKLSAFQDRLEELYASQPDFVQPDTRRNEALSFIKSGLQDISLSRAKLTWGVEVPWDPSHVFYVWFDALLNYYTALGYARPGEDLTDRFWPATYHVIGKDILKFHTVFWPAMLMAAGLQLPEHVFVHGFLLGGDGRKMSKSLGNVLDPFEAMTATGSTRCATTSAATCSSAPTGRCRWSRSRRATRVSSPTSSATLRAGRSRCCAATATVACRRASSTSRTSSPGSRMTSRSG